MPQNSLGVSDNIEKFAPAPAVEGSIEWSVSADIVSNHGNGGESSSEDEYDIEDVFGASFLPFSDSDDDGIEFQTDSADTDKNKKVRLFCILKLIIDVSFHYVWSPYLRKDRYA